MILIFVVGLSVAAVADLEGRRSPLRFIGGDLVRASFFILCLLFFAPSFLILS